MKSVFSTHPETSADPSVDACAPPSQPILVLWRTLFNDHTGAEEGLRWLRYFLGDTRWCVSVGILLEPAVAMDRLRKWHRSRWDTSPATKLQEMMFLPPQVQGPQGPPLRTLKRCLPQELIILDGVYYQAALFISLQTAT